MHMRGGVVGMHTTPIVFLYIRSNAAILLESLSRSSTSPTTSPVGGRVRPQISQGFASGHYYCCVLLGLASRRRIRRVKKKKKRAREEREGCMWGATWGPFGFHAEVSAWCPCECRMVSMRGSHGDFVAHILTVPAGTVKKWAWGIGSMRGSHGDSIPSPAGCRWEALVHTGFCMDRFLSLAGGPPRDSMQGSCMGSKERH